MDTRMRHGHRRVDLHTTTAERELIQRAVAASGTSLTDFAITHAAEAARRVLADRDHFPLDSSALKQWNAINARPAAT